MGIRDSLGMRQAVYITVDGSGRGQHKPMEASVCHVIEQTIGGVNVDVHGGLGVLHRSRNGALGGQMNHGVNAFERFRSCVRFAYIAQHDASAGGFERVQTRPQAGAQIVKHGDLMARLKGQCSAPGTDESGATGDQQPHHVLVRANAAP